MSIAAYEIERESPASQGNARPEFNAQSFDGLIQRMNLDPNVLRRDWREIVRSEFRLSAEQEQSLVDVPDDRATEIQDRLTDFADLISRGARIQGRIVKRPPEEQTPEAVHGVQIEVHLPEPVVRTSLVPRLLRIAHCDANCRNWKWNSW